MNYGKLKIAQFATILTCIILLSQSVRFTGLSCLPTEVYSKPEYLKYSGFEYPSVGGKHLFCVFSSDGAQLKPGIFQIIRV